MEAAIMARRFRRVHYREHRWNSVSNRCITYRDARSPRRRLAALQCPAGAHSAERHLQPVHDLWCVITACLCLLMCI